ncbi:uncharacterized protein HLK63_E05269 [Nakaseomyces glabratus]|nr:uncharacterized protein GW608_E05269 [Nakaseomyces glabratus]UCS25139.1 uncharacterized protein HLK63_E05269 [Nakaseomyces glabratus]UCS30369.1 uncharacterized protein HLK64_E05269 [Nakaseomyces glabratus]UCS35598.1 uncharacterized protein HLK62_E05269 [Nakaseomyces glabratus]
MDDDLDRLLEDENITEHETNTVSTPPPADNKSPQAPNKRQAYTRGTYFYEKARNQAQQDAILKRQLFELESPSEFNRHEVYPQIFQGLVLYINGFTTPGRFELHQMIVVHGGKFLHHMSAKRSVSHIIASNLPLKKRIEFANYKVVKPNWIIDSIQQKKLLPWRDYALIDTLDPDQQKLDLPLKEPTSKETATSNRNRQSGPLVSCKDPNFISDYFKHSRLHHLSTWKTDLRAKFLKDFIENNTALRKPVKDVDTYTVFHIDFDCFFATVAYLTKDPSIKCDIEKDVIVVCHGSNNSDIASCNYVARGYGIKNGMWVGHAKRLLPQGVNIVTLPYNFDEIQAKSEIFYKTLAAMKLFDMILPISIDEAICVVVNTHPISQESANTDDGSQSSNLDQLCKDIRSSIFSATNGCSVSIGCADSLLLARLALRKGKPNGYFIIDREQVQGSKDGSDEFLATFKLKDLPGVGHSIVTKLLTAFKCKDMNLAELKQRASLEFLKNCVGVKLGTKIYLALQGQDDEESTRMLFDPENYFERKSLSIEINWGIRFDNIHEIDDFIDRCCDYLLNKLNELERKTSQLTLKVMRRAANAPVDPPKYMGMGRCDAFNRTSRLGIPTNEHGTIATEAKAMYRSLACPAKELRGLSIQFNKLSKLDKSLSNVRSNLFDLLQKTPKMELSPTRSPIDFDSIEKRSPPKRLKKLNEIYSNKYDIPSTYEAQFMEALPTQLRAEVRNELKIKRKVEDMKVTDLKKKRKLTEEKERNKYNHFLGKFSIFDPIKFQGQPKFKDICSLVKEWVHSTLKEAGPHDRDVQLFEKYAKKLCNTNRAHFLCRLAHIISMELDLMEDESQNSEGFQEWEIILLKRIIPLLNQNKHTFQTERKLDIEFDFT